MEKPVKKEYTIVTEMIELHCRNNHTLCDCNLLKEYVKNRLTHCPYGGKKPACIHCKTHCYRDIERQQIRSVMRYSGPRMMLRHPLYTLLHLLKGAKIQRALYILCGIIAVILGAIGVVLPGLPTTPFMLLAAICFARSSERLYNMLLNSKLFGPLIVNWQEKRAISKKTKKVAILSVIGAGTLSLITLPTLTLKLILVWVLIIPFAILTRLKTC